MTKTSNPTSATQSQRQEDLKSLEPLTKSTHGGRRAGAGRPRERLSVRASSGVYGSETAEGSNLSYYQAWRFQHIIRHAHEFISHLTIVPDYLARPLYYEDGKNPVYPPLLSPHLALQLCGKRWIRCRRRRLTPERQLKELMRKHRGVVQQFVEQYAAGKAFIGDEEFIGLATQLLERKR